VSIDPVPWGFDPCLKLNIYSSTEQWRREDGIYPQIVLIQNGSRLVNDVKDEKGDIAHVDAVGTIPSALAAWEGIRAFHPDVIITAGTAGGVKANGATVGDVYISTDRVRYHDRRISIGNYKPYGIGSYPCLECPNLIKLFPGRIKLGVVSTGNTFDKMDPSEKEQFFQNRATIKDMEAAAIAEVAQLKGVHFLAVKSVTDLIDKTEVEGHVKTSKDSVVVQPELVEDSAAQFLQNFTIAVKNLAEIMPIITQHLLGKVPGQY